MSINNKTWALGEKITSVGLSEMTADAVNIVDDIHPQYKLHPSSEVDFYAQVFIYFNNPNFVQYRELFTRTPGGINLTKVDTSASVTYSDRLINTVRFFKTPNNYMSITLDSVSSYWSEVSTSTIYYKLSTINANGSTSLINTSTPISFGSTATRNNLTAIPYDLSAYTVGTQFIAEVYMNFAVTVMSSTSPNANITFKNMLVSLA